MIAAVFARIVGVVLGGLPALATSVSAECAWVSRTVRWAMDALAKQREEKANARRWSRDIDDRRRRIDRLIVTPVAVVMSVAVVMPILRVPTAVLLSLAPIVFFAERRPQG
jgi:hypothetical protein